MKQRISDVAPSNWTKAVVRCVVVLLLAALSGLRTFAQDPRLDDGPWPKFRGNTQNTGYSTTPGPTQSPPQVTLGWPVLLGGAIYASPSIGHDGRIWITATDGFLYCFEPTGAQSWRRYIGAGTRSSVALTRNLTAYVGSNDGSLYAVDSNGNVLWATFMFDNVDASPAIGGDGSVFVGSVGRFFKLNPATGAILSQVGPIGAWFDSSPALDSVGGTVYVGQHNSRLYAFDTSSLAQHWAFVTGGILAGAVAVGPDGSIYANSTDGYLYCLNPDGSLKWRFFIGAGATSPAVDPSGTVYSSSDAGIVFAVDSNGTEIWRFPTAGNLQPVFSSPLVAGGHVYFGCQDGLVRCLDASNGQLVWQFDTGASIFSSVGLAADGTLFAANSAGAVFALRDDSIRGTTLYLHGIGANANPAVLTLDESAPSSSTAKYKDSGPVNFNNGNPFSVIGTWNLTPASIATGRLTRVGSLRVWLGLKNSDDIGTRFDLYGEILKNGSPVASGLLRCIEGITRNPSFAKEVALSLELPNEVTFDGASDVLSLRLSTRIGTNEGGGFCSGHRNAVGLRVYFDSSSRPANVPATFEFP